MAPDERDAQSGHLALVTAGWFAGALFGIAITLLALAIAGAKTVVGVVGVVVLVAAFFLSMFAIFAAVRIDQNEGD